MCPYAESLEGDYYICGYDGGRCVNPEVVCDFENRDHIIIGDSDYGDEEEWV
jgi:hypothetical protein